jgi:hypothetical protein
VHLVALLQLNLVPRVFFVHAPCTKKTLGTRLVAAVTLCTIYKQIISFVFNLLFNYSRNERRSHVDFEKVRSLFESDDKECLLLVFCGEYFKQINSMDAGKLSWPKLSLAA